MFQRTVDVIEQQTRDYWVLSSIRTGKIKEKVTVEAFFERVNNLEYNLGPTRALLQSVKTLGEAIVAGKSSKFKKPAVVHVLPARRGLTNV